MLLEVAVIGTDKGGPGLGGDGTEGGLAWYSRPSLAL